MLWKIYFWILIALTAISYLMVGFERVWEFVDLVVYVIAILGLYAFCWRKRVLSRPFWRVYFPAYIIWNLYYLYLLALPESVTEETDMSQPVLATVNLIPFIPLMVALFLYTYYKDDIWEKQ